MRKFNSIAVLGPTACGKTRLAVLLARHFDGEIISADSRQVYRGLDLVSGKDLREYGDGETSVAHHLIDIASLEREYSLFDFQRDFRAALSDILSRKKTPILCGGTGLYADCAIRGYNLVEVPANIALRESLARKTLQELAEILCAYGKPLHNTTDLTERHRVLRAIEICEYEKNFGKAAPSQQSQSDFRPAVLCLTLPRSELRARIWKRLDERLSCGMIGEIERTRQDGISWQRIERLGLECKFIAQHLQGKIGREQMREELGRAICQFAKRQETWLRGMERKGVKMARLSSGCGLSEAKSAIESLGD